MSRQAAARERGGEKEGKDRGRRGRGKGRTGQTMYEVRGARSAIDGDGAAELHCTTLTRQSGGREQEEE